MWWMTVRASSLHRRAGLAFGIALVAFLVFVLSLASAAATPATLACTAATPLVIEPSTQGTATQAVAFVAVLNDGSACRVDAIATLTVTQAGRPVRSILGNPVRETIHATIGHGITTLFDAWWANWCGNRRAFRAQATFGPGSASGPYQVLPECITRSAPSRLRPVRNTPAQLGPLPPLG
jgi:hypothetical protein